MVDRLDEKNVSLGRLKAALHVLMEEGGDAPDDALTPDEFDDIGQMFSSRRLERGSIIERASSIEETLFDLVDLEQRARRSNQAECTQLAAVRGGLVRVCLTSKADISTLERAVQATR